MQPLMHLLHRLVLQRLTHERRHHAPVLEHISAGVLIIFSYAPVIETMAKRALTSARGGPLLPVRTP